MDAAFGAADWEGLAFCLWVLESEELDGDCGDIVLPELPLLAPMSIWIRRNCRSLSGMAARALHVKQKAVNLPQLTTFQPTKLVTEDNQQSEAIKFDVPLSQATTQLQDVLRKQDSDVSPPYPGARSR